MNCTDPTISRSISRFIRFNNLDEKYKEAVFFLSLRDQRKDSAADDHTALDLFASFLQDIKQ